MNKEALNWLAKKWTQPQAAVSPVYQQAMKNSELAKVYSMMDTRAAAPAMLNSPGVVEQLSKSRVYLGNRARLPDSLAMSSTIDGARAIDSFRRKMGSDKVALPTRSTIDMALKEYPHLAKDYKIRMQGSPAMVQEQFISPRPVNDEGVRRFLLDVKKQTGSMDELAVRSFIRKNKGVADSLVGAGTPKEQAEMLSTFYPKGMVKGPQAYEAGWLKRNEEVRSQMSNPPSVVVDKTKGSHYDGKKNEISLRDDPEKAPASYMHELEEAAATRAHPLGPGVKSLPIGMTPENFWNYSAIPGHHHMDVLKNEKKFMGKVPRYIDPLQKNIDHNRRMRESTQEYSLFNKKPQLSQPGSPGDKKPAEDYYIYPQIDPRPELAGFYPVP